MNVYILISQISYPSFIRPKDIRYHGCMRMIRTRFTIKFTFNKDVTIEKASTDDRSDIIAMVLLIWHMGKAMSIGIRLFLGVL